MFFIPFDSCDNNFHGNDLWGNKFPLHAKAFSEELMDNGGGETFNFEEAANLISFKIQQHTEQIGVEPTCKICKSEPIRVTLGDFVQ